MKKKMTKFNQSLGTLETEIMETLWEKENASVRQVLNQLRKKKNVAYTTIMTVMVRLHDKNILKRKLDSSGAYIYSPTKDKQAFLASRSKKVINNLIREFGEVAVAQFIDIIESGDIKNAKEWQKKLKKIK